MWLLLIICCSCSCCCYCCCCCFLYIYIEFAIAIRKLRIIKTFAISFWFALVFRYILCICWYRIWYFFFFVLFVLFWFGSWFVLFCFVLFWVHGKICLEFTSCALTFCTCSKSNLSPSNWYRRCQYCLHIVCSSAVVISVIGNRCR